MGSRTAFRLAMEILSTLNDFGGRLVPQTTLLNQVRATYQPPPSESEFKAALVSLESLEYVASIRDDLSQEMKWRITDEGKSKLQS